MPEKWAIAMQLRIPLFFLKVHTYKRFIIIQRMPASFES